MVGTFYTLKMHATEFPQKLLRIKIKVICLIRCTRSRVPWSTNAVCAIVRRSTSQRLNLKGMGNNKKKLKSDEKSFNARFHSISSHEHL